MADLPLASMITGKAVSDTVAAAQSIQESALSQVKDALASGANGLMSGMSSMMSNAQNLISGTITGIVGNLADSVSNFAQTVNNGLTTTLTDLSKKAGSMISDLSGKVTDGAIAKPLAFIADTTNPSVNSTSLFGKGGSTTDLLGNLTSGGLDKLASAAGLSQITNNSMLSTAISSVTSSMSKVTAGAKSILSSVSSIPSSVIGTVTSSLGGGVSSIVGSVTGAIGGDIGSVINGAVNSVTGSLTESLNSLGDMKTITGLISGNTSFSSIIDTVKNNATDSLISNVTSSVSNLVNSSGMGDTKKLISDVWELYSFGREIYDTVSGKDSSIADGIVSKFNGDFSDIQNLLNSAGNLCSDMNSKNNSKYSIQNYSANKDLTDLLLMRSSQNGMFGVIEGLMNCKDTEQYVTEDTYKLLGKEFTQVANKGDVDTASTLQKYAGNGRIEDPLSSMKSLFKNMSNTEKNNNTYSNLMSELGLSGEDILGTFYSDSNNGNFYVYDSSTIRDFNSTNPNLTNMLLGNNDNSSDTADLAESLFKQFV